MTIQRDPEGFLRHPEDWSSNLAEALAAEDNLHLTEAHWFVIHFVRDYYNKEQTSPAIRALIKALKAAHGPEKGNSLYLQQLFPTGAAKQIAKIAGLPKPKKCI